MKIICPVCRKELVKTDKSYKCINKHNFDVAKEGYVNLYLKSAVKSGDEKEMILARSNFLSKDYYSFLKEEINKQLIKYNIFSLVDLGCGQGYYTSFFSPVDKIGVDLSKDGLKIASKKDKSTLYILSSIFNVPLEDNSVDGILTCFAPVAGKEIVRILKDQGIFILVHPNEKHLYELKSAVYTNPYLNEIEKIEIEGMKLVDEYSINNTSTLDNQDLINLFKMTPYFHTTSSEDKEKLNHLKQLSITFDFIISIYQKL